MSFIKSNLFKVITFVVIIVVGFFLMKILGSSDKQARKRSVAQEVRKVETELIVHSDHPVLIEGNDTIEAQKTIDLISEVQGVITYAKNDLKSGTYVKKGEVICRIDQRLAENTYQTQFAEFTRVLTLFLAFTNTEDEQLYNKWKNYVDELDIAEPIKELPTITDDREKNQAITNNVFTQYYSLKNAEITLSKHTIVAPFSGYLTSNGLVKDSYINYNQKIASLQNVTDLEISVPLLIKDAKWIDFSKAPKVKVYWGDDENSWTEGTIARKENQLNPNSQSINVFVYLKNRSLNENLFPGNYVKVEIEGKVLSSVAEIPRYIIDNDNNIYFIDDSSRLGRITVNELVVHGDKVLIDKVLPDSTKIITSILQKPLIGMQVEDVSATVPDTSTTG